MKAGVEQISSFFLVYSFPVAFVNVQIEASFHDHSADDQEDKVIDPLAEIIEVPADDVQLDAHNSDMLRPRLDKTAVATAVLSSNRSCSGTVANRRKHQPRHCLAR